MIWKAAGPLTSAVSKDKAWVDPELQLDSSRVPIFQQKLAQPGKKLKFWLVPHDHMEQFGARHRALVGTSVAPSPVGSNTLTRQRSILEF